MPSLPNLAMDAAKAQDLSDLASHIAWTDIVSPELTKLRETYSTQLVQKVLNAPGSSPLTIEQLAGRIEGIDFIKRLFTRIIEKGEKAQSLLRERQFILEDPYNSNHS